MDVLKFEQLSEKEMTQIQGRGWIYCDGEWKWVENYGLDGNEEKDRN